MTDADDSWYPVKIVIGIRTYGNGATPDEALREAVDRITHKPVIDEDVYQMAVLKEWVKRLETPMTLKQMLMDTSPTSWSD
jgi:hypothetical protein